MQWSVRRTYAANAHTHTHTHSHTHTHTHTHTYTHTHARAQALGSVPVFTLLAGILVGYKTLLETEDHLIPLSKFLEVRMRPVLYLVFFVPTFQCMATMQDEDFAVAQEFVSRIKVVREEALFRFMAGGHMADMALHYNRAAQRLYSDPTCAEDPECGSWKKLIFSSTGYFTLLLNNKGVSRTYSFFCYFFTALMGAAAWSYGFQDFTGWA